jgi:hypothetical protein
MANLTDSVKFLVLACETKNNGSPTLLGAGWADCAGWNQVTWLLALGTIDTTVDLKIQESDDAATWVDIAGKALVQIPGTGDNKAYAIEVPRGGETSRKRYQKPVCVVGSGATGAALAILCALGAFSAQAVDVASQDLGQRV